MNPYQINIAESDENFLSEHKKERNFKQKELLTIKILQSCCNSIAFNANNTILFLGLNNGQIKEYCFNNKRKLIQILFNPFSDLVCLIWGKKSKQLISGHSDGIIIWELDKNNQLRPLQILKPKDQDLICMILNKEEDLMVSSSVGFCIQFWQKEQQSWMCSQILKTQGPAKCLSFNPPQNKLILCEVLQSNQIKVIEKEKNKNWVVTQSIISFHYFGSGKKICFLNGTQFVFQQNSSLEIYDYQQEQNKFVKTQQIYIQYNGLNFFPCQFTKSENILIANQGNYINNFSIDKYGNFFQQSAILFGRTFLYGSLSDDGQYQITSHERQHINQEHEIQVRKIFE